MNPEAVIAQFVARARRRFLWNQAMTQAVFAATLGAGGVIALLLAGTQILSWRWLAPLIAGGLGAGLWRVLRRLPSAYRVAQLADDRAGLHDAVSTAVFFASSPEGRGAILGMQREAAARAVAGVPIEQAMPYTVPRGVYLMGMLALVAASLFTLRYGFARRMDLERPILTVLFDPYGLVSQQAARQSRLPKQPNLRDVIGVPLDETDGGDPAKLGPAPDNVLDTIDTPDVNAEVDPNADARSKPGAHTPGEQSIDEKQDADPGEGGEPGSGSDKSSDQSGDKSGKQQADKNGRSPGSNSNENNTLLSKLRDAMNNLMSRMKDNGSEKMQGKGQSADSQNQKANSGEKGQPGQGKQSAGQQSSQAQDGQDGESSEQARNGEGKSGGKSSDSDSVNAPGSGMGKQDGAKDVKLAEQAAAMGKISEIIGKRSQNVSGEVTVEVQSSKQQLRTPYSPGQSQHAEAGGDISRDEVPVALQPFVQQYFEQVRKQDSAAPATPPKPQQ